MCTLLEIFRLIFDLNFYRFWLCATFPGSFMDRRRYLFRDHSKPHDSLELLWSSRGGIRYRLVRMDWPVVFVIAFRTMLLTLGCVTLPGWDVASH